MLCPENARVKQKLYVESFIAQQNTIKSTKILYILESLLWLLYTKAIKSPDSPDFIKDYKPSD